MLLGNLLENLLAGKNTIIAAEGMINASQDF